MKKHVAILTMVYNEGSNLKRWIAHHLKQANNDITSLYVVDHGSDDGSTDSLECNVIKLPRDSGGDQLQMWRANYISELCAKLLRDYMAVLYTDCDELVVADPSKYSSLANYAMADGKSNATIGFDVLHDFEIEPDLTDSPVLSQRNILLFSGSMCKPTFTRNPVKFAPGFHCSSEIPVFGDLYRFHLRYADLSSGLQRLELTRNLKRESKGSHIDHQKISNETFKIWIKAWLKKPFSGDEIGENNEDFRAFKAGLSLATQPDGVIGFNYNHAGERLARVPESFRFLA